MRQMKLLALSAVFLTFTLSCDGKEIDLSTRSEETGDYYVAFCARVSPSVSSLPGHAFAALSHRNPMNERDLLAIGLTAGPAPEIAAMALSFFGPPVHGYLAEEHYTARMQDCLNVKVNHEDYERALRLTENPLHIMGIGGPRDVVLQAYRLGEQDCISFLKAVAETLRIRGLRIPVRSTFTFPIPYVQRMIEMN